MSDLVLTVTDANFEEVVQKSPVPFLLDFWAPWCSPCVSLIPTLDQMAEAYGEKLKIGKMNVEENAVIPQQMAVRGIPRLVLFSGGEIVGDVTGANVRKIQEMCEKVAGPIS